MKQVAAILWTRIPTPRFQAKTRIGLGIRNQELANHLSLLLARLAVENIKHPEIDLYLYHQEVKGKVTNIQSIFNNTFAGSYTYQNQLGFMGNVHRSLRLLLDLGYKKAVLLVSDCPWFDQKCLGRMLSLLDTYDLVLQPAIDEGVNAIGCSSNLPQYFPLTNTVSRTPGYHLLSTLQSFLTSQGVSHYIMKPALLDVDLVEDVQVVWDYLNEALSSARETSDFNRLYDLHSFLSKHKGEFQIK